MDNIETIQSVRSKKSDFIDVKSNDCYKQLLKNIDSNQKFYLELENCITTKPLKTVFFDDNKVQISFSEKLPENIILYSYYPNYIELIAEKIENNPNNEYKINHYQIALSIRANQRVNVESLGLHIKDIKINTDSLFFFSKFSWLVIDASKKGLLVEVNPEDDIQNIPVNAKIEFTIKLYTSNEINIKGEIKAIKKNCERKTDNFSIELLDLNKETLERWLEFVSYLAHCSK